jgi:hypothetical protein
MKDYECCSLLNDMAAGEIVVLRVSWWDEEQTNINNAVCNASLPRFKNFPGS